MNLLILVLLPLFIGIIISLFKNTKMQILGDLTRIFVLIQACFNLNTVVRTNTPIVLHFTDSGLLGIGLVSDRVSSLLIVTTALLFFVFGIYMRNKKGHDNLLHCLFLIIEGTIIILFMSIDLFNIFVLLEVSTIICGILIMYMRDKRSVYDGLIYIMLNTVGIIFYLLGVGFMYKIFGNLDIPTISSQIAGVPKKELVLPFAFLMCGLSIKSALFPVYLWLPKAHGTPGAPSIVSAMLSGIFVKSSLFILIRLSIIFQLVFPINKLLLVIGVITAISGFLFAILSKDLKLILAYHTISQIGLILIGATSNHAIAYSGSILHIINHALFKSLLFLSIGTIDYMYKTRKITSVRGVMKRSPIVGISLIVGVLGITGAPFFNGSISKYLISSGYNSTVMQYIMELINFGTIVSFVKLSSILFGKSTEKDNSDANDKAALIMISLAVFLSGVFGFRLHEVLTGTLIHMSLISLLEKSLIWFIYVALAIALFRFVLPKFKVYREGISINLSFNTMILNIVVGFLVYFVFGYFVAI